MKKSVIIIMIFVILAGIGVGIYFATNKEKNVETGSKMSIRNTVLTKDNYEEMTKRIENEFNKNDEEIYYASYAMMYYITTDGLKNAFTNPNDEDAMYVNIYGKTINQLIDEGKKLMKDNNMTIEKFKQQLETLSKQ